MNTKKPVASMGSDTYRLSEENSSCEPKALVTQDQARRLAPIANMIPQPSQPEVKFSDIPCMKATSPRAEPKELTLAVLDPALFSNDVSGCDHDEKSTLPLILDTTHPTDEQQQGTITELLQRPGEDCITCPFPNARGEAPLKTVSLDSRDSFKQPAASSLVSPPASLNDDAGNSPRSAEGNWTPSAPSSRQSSRQPKQAHRYTPESGPMRRASSSSYGENTAEKDALTLSTEPCPSHKLTKLSSEAMDFEDLRLIKKIQAEEYGLRRRGRA